MPEAFEVRHRRSLYIALAVASLVLGAGFGWLAYDRGDLVLVVPAVVLLLIGLTHVRGLRDTATPLFVADDHGVRLRSDHGWVGLLWSELGEIRVERREGFRHDPRIKVVSSDGQKFYTSPLGLATDVSPAEAEVQLARRRSTASY